MKKLRLAVIILFITVLFGACKESSSNDENSDIDSLKKIDSVALNDTSRAIGDKTQGNDPIWNESATPDTTKSSSSW